MEDDAEDDWSVPPTSVAEAQSGRRPADVRTAGRAGRTARNDGARAKRDRHGHGWGFRVFEAVAILLLAAVGCVGCLAILLARGPVSLAFCQHLIEQAVTAELDGGTFSMQGAELALNGSGLEIALSGLRITGTDGATLAQAPQAVAVLSGEAALHGHIGFSSVDLINPRLQVFYADDGTLSVKFAGLHADAQAGAPTPAVAAEPGPAATDAIATAASPKSEPINFVQALTDLSAKARRRENVAAYLREVGLRQATIVIDNGRRKTIWRTPEIRIDLRHKAAGSLIGGHAVIDGLAGPWSLDFRASEALAAQQVVVEATVHGLNPGSLSRQVPMLVNLRGIDVPLDGEVRINLTAKGQVGGATFALEAQRGRLSAPGGPDSGPDASTRTGVVESGALKGRYDAAAAQVTFERAALAVDHNHLELTGTATRAAVPASNGLALWNFEFTSTGGAIAPLTPLGKPVAVDQFRVRGQLVPDAARLLVQEMALDAGGASITATGSVSDLATDANRSADLEARVAPMPVAQLMALWPSTLASGARTWLAEHVTKGQLKGGTIKLASSGDNRVSMALDLAGLEVQPAPDLPPLLVPRALVRVEGGGLEINAPDAALGPGRQALQLKGVRVTAVRTPDGTPPVAEVVFRVLGPLAAAVDIAGREPFALFKSRGIAVQATDGRLDGQFKVTLPVSEHVQSGDIKVEGRLHLVDGRLRQALGPLDVTGAKFNIDVSETAIDVRGDFLVKGIPVKVAGQHFLNSTPDRQSPFRLQLKLDDADRAQLGLDINDLVAGDIPVEILVGPDAAGDYQAHLNADITNAELTLDSVAFRKAPGEAGSVQFDPAKAANGRLELRNFRITGRRIAAEGMIVLGANNKALDVSFPEFSLNTVSRMELHGHLKADNVWDIHAKGATFDGRELFREFFKVQNTKKRVAKDKAGLDLVAEIETVVGFSDTNLKNVHLLMQKRTENGTEKITFMDVTATHDTGKAFDAHIRPAPATGGAKLTASSDDAGQIFKAVGFYPNAAGGHMGLEVNLGGRGSEDRTGVLKAEKFTVLGDPVVSQVFQNGGDGPAPTLPHGQRRKVVREKFDFDWMVLPFSVGSGQFVMNKAEIRGPLIGATLRGKVDFDAERMQIAGTYIPLSGLNSVIGGVPVIGQIFGGIDGEGVFGFTFVAQGPLANPEVLVNPFSGFFPGLLRETQQMAPESFKITPRGTATVPAPIPGKNAARASSSGPTTAGSGTGDVTPRAQAPGVLSDWKTADPRTGTKPPVAGP